MSQNLILERTDQVRYHTNMWQVIDALGINCTDYDWYVSDIETNHDVAGFETIDQWLGGDRLFFLITENEIQFVWAVFSAFKKGNAADVAKAPYADGNPTYWSDEIVQPQLSGVEFEITCWDSSATILVGITEA